MSVEPTGECLRKRSPFHPSYRRPRNGETRSEAVSVSRRRIKRQRERRHFLPLLKRTCGPNPPCSRRTLAKTIRSLKRSVSHDTHGCRIKTPAIVATFHSGYMATIERTSFFLLRRNIVEFYANVSHRRKVFPHLGLTNDLIVLTIVTVCSFVRSCLMFRPLVEPESEPPT